MAICIRHRKTLTSALGRENVCVECIEEAAINIAKNFGKPDCYICSECGLMFDNQEYYIEHLPCRLVPC